MTKKDRTQNLAGHVQFFTARSFRKLLASSGLELDVLDHRRYLPTLDLDTIRFVCRKNGSSRATYLKMLLGRYLRIVLGPLWSYVLQRSLRRARPGCAGSPEVGPRPFPAG